MSSNLAFKQHFHVQPIPEEKIVYLLSEARKSALQGDLYLQLADILDGTRSIEQIISLLQRHYSRHDIQRAVFRLQEKGFLTEKDTEVPESVAAFWDVQDLDLQGVFQVLNSSSYCLHNLSSADPSSLLDMLQASGLQQDQTKYHLALVVVDDYLQTELASINAEFLHSNTPWLLVKPHGINLWLGPLFLPHQTGCWECLKPRIQDGREVETVLQKNLQMDSPFFLARASLPSTSATAFSLFATQVLQAIVHQEASPLAGRIMTLNTVSLCSEFHPLCKRPQCPVCGNHQALAGPPEPVVFQNNTKKFTEDGGHRICSPAQTLAKYKHLLSPVTGVVNELLPLFTAGDGLVHIYGGFHRIAHTAMPYAHLKHCLRNKSTGKGKTEVQARASAFCEAVERYCAHSADEAYTVHLSRNQLQDAAVDIENCMLFSVNQYATREQWNEKYGMHMFVPERLDHDMQIDWCPVWSVHAERLKYLPASYCYLKVVKPGEPMYFVPESNGLAAGNSKEEAVLQGFLELVERDSVAIWWYNSLQMPEVDLESFGIPYFQALKDYYAGLGREFWVLDVTNDFDIPTFVAVSRQIGSGREMIIYGCGTHLEPGIGISRALTEMNQFLYLQEQGRISNHAVLEREHYMRDYWFNQASIEQLPFLWPNARSAVKSCADYKQQFNSDLLDDLRFCFDKAEELGLEVLVYDMTRPDIGLNVVRVVMPGARHWRPRYAPGRLFDVPVKMGWQQAALKENELNPLFIWI